MALPTENFIYQRATDNVCNDATIAVQSGTEDATYPAANLQDGIPSKPAQLTTPTGAWTFNFTGPQRVDLMSIVMHNLDAGLSVRFQGHTADSWATPDIDLPIIIPPYRLDGFPYNPWLDLTTLVPVPANRTKEWWRLVVVGTNSANVKIGEVWLGATKRNLTRNIKWGSTRREFSPGVQHETDFMVKLKYHYGVLRRTASITIENTDETHEEVMAWGQSCRWMMHPTLIVPIPGVNDAWLCSFVNIGAEWVRESFNYTTINLELEELSRGLVL